MRFLSLAAALTIALLSPCRAHADTFLGEDTEPQPCQEEEEKEG